MNYPDDVTSKAFNEDLRTFTMRLADPLKYGYLKVRGIEFDAKVTIDLIRKGENGPPEIVDIDTRHVSVVVYPDSNGGDVETFRVDESEGWRAWEEEFEVALREYALKLAKESHTWELLEEE